MPQPQDERHHVVIVGGGFGGLHAARALKRAPVRVTLIDRRNFHLFQPLLYQVATGGLSPANIAAPLRTILRRQKNVETLLGEVTGIDVAGRRVLLQDGAVAYDTLIVAAGAKYDYFGHDEWRARAPSLKSIEDATEIRRRVLLAFEAAERETDPQRRREWLTFVIVGAGPTGVELAGTLAEIARHSFQNDFRHVDPAEANIVLVEGGDHVLDAFPQGLSERAEQSLRELGVTVRTGCLMTDLDERDVLLKCGEQTERLTARTVLWTAGVKGSSLGRALAEATGAEVDRGGRLIVEPEMSVPGHPDVFVIGDLAHFDHGLEQPLPGLAPVAIQQGKYVAKLVRARLKGRDLPPFRYRDYGNMATIGRSRAVADLGRFRLSGLPAWLLWLFVHLMQLVGFANRLLVFVQWMWCYLTYNRTARLITGDVLPLFDEGEDALASRAVERAADEERGTARHEEPVEAASAEDPQSARR